MDERTPEALSTRAPLPASPSSPSDVPSSRSSVPGLASRRSDAMAAESLVLRAGSRARALIRERGLRADDVDVLPGASGGAKWLVLGGLDRLLFGEFFAAPRTRPLYGIGSSIGSWRLACLAQRDPLAALARGHHAYVYEQNYTPKPTTREITDVLVSALDRLLGPNGAREIVSHPFLKLHVLVTRATGWAASDDRRKLAAAIGTAALLNALGRRTLGRRMERIVFHDAGARSPFEGWADLPTRFVSLTAENVRAALMASGSIPLLVDPVRFPDDKRAYWDGGVLDYHLDLDFGPGDGLVLYPHFYSHIVPGWFDKRLTWRFAGATHFERALVIAPSRAFVASLPGGRIPDRHDFYTLSHAERIARWQRVNDESERLGDALRDLIARNAVATRLTDW